MAYTPDIGTVGALIDALQRFDPEAPVGTPDFPSDNALIIGTPYLNENGVVMVGTGGLYRGIVGQHYCDQECPDDCEREEEG